MKKERILVVGGLSAGPSAAAKARRENENAEIILFEKEQTLVMLLVECRMLFRELSKIEINL